MPELCENVLTDIVATNATLHSATIAAENVASHTPEICSFLIDASVDDMRLTKLSGGRRSGPSCDPEGRPAHPHAQRTPDNNHFHFGAVMAPRPLRIQEVHGRIADSRPRASRNAAARRQSEQGRPRLTAKAPQPEQLKPGALPPIGGASSASHGAKRPQASH